MSWVRNNVSKQSAEKRLLNLQSLQKSQQQQPAPSQALPPRSISGTLLIEEPSDIIEYTNRSCLDFIDAILYINLDHRLDRNSHILSEINKICNDKTKIHRISAIKRDNGALGCGLSHIKALEFIKTHPNWNTILILEDDFTFKSNNLNEINHKIVKLLENNNMDMGLLSHNNLLCSDTDEKLIKKVFYSITTSSYIIKSEYVDTLLNNMRESMSDMEKNGKKHDNCLDIYWTKLQPISNWYAIYPAIGYQYDNYSDIENKHCAYNC